MSERDFVNQVYDLKECNKITRDRAREIQVEFINFRKTALEMV